MKPVKTNTERAIIGALGGLAAVLVKFLGQDYDLVVANAANLPPQMLVSFAVGYGLLTPILMFLGGFVAWSSDETSKMKLVALAIAAPAMITTWSGGNKGAAPDIAGLLVTPAYAQPAGAPAPVQAPTPAVPGTAVPAPQSPPPQSTWEAVQSGVGVFFGYNKVETRYWVIVGSFRDIAEAQRFAENINRQDASLQAWVGEKVPPNEFYPVIVGGYNVLSEARAIRDKALATSIIKDAYLSSGARR